MSLIIVKKGKGSFSVRLSVSVHLLRCSNNLFRQEKEHKSIWWVKGLPRVRKQQGSGRKGTSWGCACTILHWISHHSHVGSQQEMSTTGVQAIGQGGGVQTDAQQTEGWSEGWHNGEEMGGGGSFLLCLSGSPFIPERAGTRKQSVWSGKTVCLFEWACLWRLKEIKFLCVYIYIFFFKQR